MSELESPTCWLELSRANLLHNLAGVRALVGASKIMAAVKANAYGAGAVGVARVLSSASVDAFGVATVAEGVELREHGIAGEILLLTYFTRDEVDAIFDYDLAPALFTVDAARRLAEHAQATNRRARVWIKVDTGLGRLGVPFQSARGFIQQVMQYSGMEVAGLFSTLTENPARDQMQVQRLLDVRRHVPEFGGVPLSIASSNGILSLRASYLDMVRPGIMLLGLDPSERERMDVTLVRQADLRPIVTWKTRVGYVKVVSEGEQVGYSCRAPLERETPIATLTIGWANGYAPAMSRAGHVLLHGRRVPVVAVSAHSTMVDVTDSPAIAIGDEVVLLGMQGDAEITTAEMARATGESVYRMLATIPREIPRIWN